MIVPERIVKENTLAYFKGDELATTVWMKKYALKNQAGEFVETGPLDRFETIAKEICRIDAKYHSNDPLSYDVVFALLKNGYFLPGGSALSGIGNDYTVTSLGNCFVISGNKEDSYGSILKNDQEIVQIAKRRGGIGLDISHLRPENSVVLNAAGSSTGAVSFAHRFSNSTREVAQSGRRGALMLSMHINHPDILKFISVKDDETSVTGANLSVRVTDEFMRAVEEDGIHQLRYPVDFPYVKSDHFTLNQVYKGSSGNMFINVKAREIFNKLVEVNWRRAEPGLLFWDTIKRESPADGYTEYKSESTNPCGEIPLSPYDSCRLLSVNATAFVKNPFTSDAYFQTSLFRTVAKTVTRIMDNIIDLEIEKIEAIIKKVKSDPESDEVKAVELHLWESVLGTTINGRRAGISIIGHGDLLAMLGLKYGSDEATKFVSEIHEFFARAVYEESIDLAKVRGAFPSFNVRYETSSFLKRIGVDKVPRRNIALLTIPPSGSLSILFNNQSSGIEPVFAPWYTRRRKVSSGEKADFKDKTGDLWETYNVLHNNFVSWGKVNGIDLTKCSTEELQEHLKNSPYFEATSNFVDPIAKVKMQGEIQKYICHSISMTNNLPQHATLTSVAEVYMEAWKSGCKGATIYREGSRSGVLNTTPTPTETFVQHDAPKRPKDLPCDIFHPSINGEKYIVMVGLLEGKPYEVFALKKVSDSLIPAHLSKGVLRKRKSKDWVLLHDDKIIVEDILSEFKIPEYEFATKMISTALRHGASIDFVVKQLSDSEGMITDYAKVIARQLKKYITPKEDGSACPSCGQSLVIEAGCKQCKNPECGYGQCG